MFELTGRNKFISIEIVKSPFKISKTTSDAYLCVDLFTHVNHSSIQLHGDPVPLSVESHGVNLKKLNCRGWSDNFKIRVLVVRLKILWGGGGGLDWCMKQGKVQ